MTHWPDGMAVDPIGAWPGTLTAKRTASQFGSPLASTLALLQRELNQLRARNVRLQVAIPASQFRLDGYPRATAKQDHPGVILTLDSEHGPLSYPCDTFTDWPSNLRAIALALEALRKVDRYGVTKRGEQYRGFLAIEGATAMPAAFKDAHEAWAFIMRIATGPGVVIRVENADRGAIHLALRAAKRKSHPDTGGDAETFQRVTLAEQYLKKNGAI